MFWCWAFKKLYQSFERFFSALINKNHFSVYISKKILKTFLFAMIHLNDFRRNLFSDVIYSQGGNLGINKSRRFFEFIWLPNYFSTVSCYYNSARQCFRSTRCADGFSSIHLERKKSSWSFPKLLCQQQIFFRRCLQNSWTNQILNRLENKFVRWCLRVCLAFFNLPLHVLLLLTWSYAQIRLSLIPFESPANRPSTL